MSSQQSIQFLYQTLAQSLQCSFYAVLSSKISFDSGPSQLNGIQVTLCWSGLAAAVQIASIGMFSLMYFLTRDFNSIADMTQSTT